MSVPIDRLRLKRQTEAALEEIEEEQLAESGLTADAEPETLVSLSPRRDHESGPKFGERFAREHLNGDGSDLSRRAFRPCAVCPPGRAWTPVGGQARIWGIDRYDHRQLRFPCRWRKWSGGGRGSEAEPTFLWLARAIADSKGPDLPRSSPRLCSEYTHWWQAALCSGVCTSTGGSRRPSMPRRWPPWVLCAINCAAHLRGNKRETFLQRLRAADKVRDFSERCVQWLWTY